MNKEPPSYDVQFSKVPTHNQFCLGSNHVNYVVVYNLWGQKTFMAKNRMSYLDGF